MYKILIYNICFYAKLMCIFYQSANDYILKDISYNKLRKNLAR